MKKSNKKNNVEAVEVVENVEAVEVKENENTAEVVEEVENVEAVATVENVEAVNPIDATQAELVNLGIVLSNDELQKVIDIFASKSEAFRKAQKNKPSLLSSAIDYLIEKSKEDEEIRVAGLNCKEITDGLLESGRYHTEGKTPDQSLYTAFVRYVEKEGENAKVIKSRVKGLWKVNKAVVSLD